MSTPRTANPEELQLLAEELSEGDSTKIEKTLTIIREHAYIAVFDDYITDGPCYAGPVMLVVWSFTPNYYEAYTWREKDKLQLVSQMKP